MHTTNNGLGPGFATPESANGLDSCQVQPVKSIYQNASEIVACFKRFALLSPLPIVLCTTTALQATVAIVWVYFA